MNTNNYNIFWDNWHDVSNANETLTTSDPDRLTGRYINTTIATLLRHINIDDLHQHTILDYGCGTGRLAKHLAPICRQLIAVDVSPKMLATAQSRLSAYHNVSYILADPSRPLSIGDRVVDFTFSYAALGYFGASAKFWFTIDEIDRVSKSFALQLHALTNEDPDTVLTIDHSADQDIHSMSCYRPSEKTIKKRFPHAKYIIERHEPDIRGKDMFFYKIDRSCLYLKYGLPAEALSVEDNTQVSTADSTPIIKRSLLMRIARKMFNALPVSITHKLKSIVSASVPK